LAVFFLYPFGQTGFTAVIFLINLPLTQLIVSFFILGVTVTLGEGEFLGVAVGVGVGVGVGDLLVVGVGVFFGEP
jgi:hypothetical protein